MKTFLAEVESRAQGLRPRPRTQRKSEAKDSPSEDKSSRGQGQECSRPRTKDTGASALIKKKGLQNFFQAISKPGKQKISWKIFSEVSCVFLNDFKNEQIPTIVGTNANAHHLYGGPPK